MNQILAALDSLIKLTVVTTIRLRMSKLLELNLSVSTPRLPPVVLPAFDLGWAGVEPDATTLRWDALSLLS